MPESHTMRVLTLLLTLVSTLLLGSDACAQGRRRALVIGNSAYEVGALTNPRNDVVRMTDVLREIGFTVRVFHDQTGESMRAEVDRFSEDLVDGDTVLVFYSGHGISAHGQNLLVGVNNRSNGARFDESIRNASISIEWALTRIRRRNVTALLFFDACRNVDAELEFVHMVREEGAILGFDSLRAPPNSLIAFSAQPRNTASDGPPDTNSPFTTALAQYLPRRGADVEEVLRLVRVSVLSQTGGSQTPWHHSSLTARVALGESRNSLPMQSCSLLGTIRSVRGGTASTVTFINRTHAPLSFVWIDPAGRPRRSTPLSASAQREQGSRVGEVWMVRSATGSCRGLYQVTPETAFVTIDD